MNQYDYDAITPENNAEIRLIADTAALAFSIKLRLQVFDFDDLDELTSGDFLGWFYDRVTEGTYQNTFNNLITRTHSWVVTDAGDIADDYADYIVGSRS